MTIPGDTIVSSAEQRAGLALLKTLRLYRDAVRLHGVDSLDALARRVTLAFLERDYDSMPTDDRQVRDNLDDAMLCAGWERVA